MMNVIALGGRVLFLSVHGGGGVLRVDLSAPVLRGRDVGDGCSVRFEMVEEPGEVDYAETRLYRFDGVRGNFSILDGVFGRGERELVVGGLECLRRYAWLPAAFDVEGNFVPGGVVGVRVTDGSVGLVEGVRGLLVEVLREDAGLRGYHAEWGAEDEGRCHVFDGVLPGGRSVGRAPYLEVGTREVVSRSPFVVRAVYEVRVGATDGLERLADDVGGALTVGENRWLRSEHVMGVGVRCGEAEGGFPLRRMTVLVEVEMARVV